LVPAWKASLRSRSACLYSREPIYRAARLPGADHGVRAARLTSIKADIHRNLTDSSLTAAALAARHDITVRYLHKLFEDEAMTVSQYVLDGRLALARQLLSNPLFADRTISSIAGAAGFGDLSYFNRTFRRRYSVTPSDVRSGGGLSEGSGFPVLSVLPAGAGLWRAGAVSRFGEADRMRRDRRSDLDAVAGSGTMDRREDGTVQPRLRRRVSLTDQW